MACGSLEPAESPAFSNLAFIKKQQTERVEARIAKPSTKQRDARLLREGTPRRQTEIVTPS
jgi:hypothetical protein